MALTKRIIMVITIILLLLETTAFGLTIKYRFDAFSRLTRVERSDGSITTYTYDAVGNRISKISTTSVLKGDINNDGTVTLADAVLILQVISGLPPAASVNNAADVNSDGKVGLPEALYILQKAAGAR
jgi:YD repeat-containing protein